LFLVAGFTLISFWFRNKLVMKSNMKTRLYKYQLNHS
jgi:hypothetical protein